MARTTITQTAGQYPRASLESSDNADRLVTMANEHATALDAVEAKTAYILTGAGSPAGVVSAPVGTLYLRTDGGAGTTLYVKQSGSGNTGWQAMLSA